MISEIDSFRRKRAANILTKKLKLYLYESCIHGGRLETDSFECSICIDSGKHGVSLICGHTFHLCCILKWIDCERSCPMCRKHTEDKRILKIEKKMLIIKEIFESPTESLLNFQTAIHVNLYTQHTLSYEMMYALRIGMQMSPENIDFKILHMKVNMLNNIQHEIVLFDKCKSVMDSINFDDSKKESVRLRLCNSFENLHDRVKSPWKELSVLKDDNCFPSRMLRNRLCALWKIERMIHNFEQTKRQSRTIVPFRHRIGLIGEANSNSEVVSFLDMFRNEL